MDILTVALGVAAGMLAADITRWAVRKWWRIVTSTYGRSTPPPWDEPTPLKWRHAWFVQRRIFAPIRRTFGLSAFWPR